MQVSVEALTNIERRMTIVVPFEKLDKAFDERINKLAKTANVKGFRPGKAPLSHIKQFYGDSARQEALSDVIQKSIYAAIDQEKLNPVSTPMVEPKEILPGQPLEFVVKFEVLPPIENVHFNVDKIEKEIATIKDEDVEKVIQHLRNQHVIWKTVNRPAQEKDQAIIDFSGAIEGVKFAGGEAHDYPIVLGSKMMIPGFEEGVLGMSRGEERVIDVTFPENYFAKEVAGKVAQFTIKIIQVSEPDLPDLNDAYVKKLGIKSGTVEDLQAEIRRNLERELARVVKAKMKAQVFDKLLEQNPIEVPNALIEREAKRIHDELHPHHHGHEHAHTEEENASFNEAGKRNVKLGLLVGELVKKYQLKADTQRIQTAITEMASVYEAPEQVIKWYNENKQKRAEMEMLVLEDQLVEKLTESVKVTEKVLSYNELIANTR